MGRELKIAILVGAMLCGIAAGVWTGMTPDAPTETATSEPAAAAAPEAPKQAEVEIPPKQKAQAQHEKNPPHVRLSNVRMLQPPEKKDFTKVAAPEKDKPVDEESE